MMASRKQCVIHENLPSILTPIVVKYILACYEITRRWPCGVPTACAIMES